MVKLTVDQKEIEADEDAVLLKVCLDNGIYIPNLCYMEDRLPAFAGCRLCFVEIEGMASPVTSCTVRVREGMTVRTDTPRVRELQTSGLRLLLSTHEVDCKNCPANKACELQRIARFLKAGLKPKHLNTHLKPLAVDTSHPVLDYYPNRCVLCGKCIHVSQRNGKSCAFTFVRRGFETVISSYGSGEAADCPQCQACVDACPVGALVINTDRGRKPTAA